MNQAWSQKKEQVNQTVIKERTLQKALYTSSRKDPFLCHLGTTSKSTEKNKPLKLCPPRLKPRSTARHTICLRPNALDLDTEIGPTAKKRYYLAIVSRSLKKLNSHPQNFKQTNRCDLSKCHKSAIKILTFLQKINSNERRYILQEA